MAVLEVFVARPMVSAGVSARPQREARQVQGLDQDWCLGNKTVKMIAWSFSKICTGGLPVQSEILKKNQMIYNL